MYKVSYKGNEYYPDWEVDLEYAEMVQLFFGYCKRPSKGDEYCDSVLKKAKFICSKLPVTDY